jgi:hypothetical protein
MTMTYIQAIGIGFPAVQCHALGDGSVYEEIVWDAGAPVPDQATLDAWIAANPDISTDSGVVLTKYAFRQLFTLPERIAIDNAPSNTAIPANYRAMLLTMSKDMELSAEVHLSKPDTIAGVGFLEQLGLIAAGRAAQVLSNVAP